MRKILGFMKQLPCPDTFGAISTAFEAIEDKQLASLGDHFPPFYEVTTRYEDLVRNMQASSDGWNKQRYGQSILELFMQLPVTEITEIVKGRFPNTFAKFPRDERWRVVNDVQRLNA